MTIRASMGRTDALVREAVGLVPNHDVHVRVAGCGVVVRRDPTHVLARNPGGSGQRTDAGPHMTLPLRLRVQPQLLGIGPID